MFKERFFHTLFALCAMGSIFAVCAICFFLFANAIPTMKQIGFMDFIFGLDWYPEQEFFGIFPMIIGSLCVTALAILFGHLGFLVRFIYRSFVPKVQKSISSWRLSCLGLSHLLCMDSLA